MLPASIATGLISASCELRRVRRLDSVRTLCDRHGCRLVGDAAVLPGAVGAVSFDVCRTPSSSSSLSSSSFYVDTQVKVDTFANTLAETELLEKGWSNVRPSVETWATQSLSISPLVSSVFDVSSSTSPSTW